MWLDIQQNQDEWLDLRAGKVTGSSIGKIMANFGKKFGDPAKRLAINIAVERITGKRIEQDNYKNSHMDRGHEQEPIARQRYEELYFVDVSNGGFYDNKKTGCSPDGRVLVDNGLIEIKSVIATTHYNNIKRGSYDPAYKWQYIFNLRESKCDYIDFISYCSEYPQEQNLYAHRINKTDVREELSQIKIRLNEFESLVGKITTEIKGA
ncbi:MAG: YqaJ viral recombinase family protein [Bacteroidetes bacterium]|nr:YqaJ viral recombinase family protein [Bacteroidota bacterium]